MKHTSIKKNFIYQMIYEVVIIILPLATSPYIARVIGPKGVGIYSYHYSIAYYFMLFSVLGLKNYGNRAIAKCRDNRDDLNTVFSNLLTLHIIISTLVTLLYIVYILLFVSSSERIYAYILTFAVLSSLFDISWFYFGIERFKVTVTVNILTKIASFISIFVFVKNYDDLWIYCLILALGFFFQQFLLWFPLKKYVTFVKPTTALMMPHIKPMLILFIPSIAVSFYKYMDKIMIGLISDKVQLGYYENAEKVVAVPNTIIGAFGTVMLPRMSNIIDKKDRKETLRYTQISMLYVMWMAYALAFGLASVARVFAPIFWGERFSVSGDLIMGLCITIPFMSFANVIRTQFLIPAERDREFIISLISGAVVNLIINYLLLPELGAMGAAIGTIVTETIVCLIQCWYVRRDLPIGEYFKQSSIFIAFGTLMFVVSYQLGRIFGTSIKTLLLQILCGVLIYLSISMIYFRIKKEPTFMSFLTKLKKLKPGKRV